MAFVPRTRMGILGVVAAITAAVLVAIVVLSAPRGPGTGASPSPGSSAEGPSVPPVSSPSSVPGPSPTAGPPAVEGVVRVDQLGYLPDESKVAYLLAASPAAGAPFKVLDAGGTVVLEGAAGPDRGPWNDAWPAVHPLDITAVTAPGMYTIELAGVVAATSPPFRVGTSADLFAPRVDDAVAFFQAQRDGPDVIPGELGRKPSHLNDRDLDVFDWPRYEDPDSDAIVGKLTRVGRGVDLAGGWFDAGDFIKFTHTTAYSVGLMYLAAREMGAAAPAGLTTEARFGQDWLERAWDPATGTLYLQVGIGSGNTDGTFLGDHDLWRLPEEDDALAGADNRYLRSRPAFRANDPGTRLPPNLAGRLAAALALAAQVDAAHDPPAPAASSTPPRRSSAARRRRT